MSQPIPEMPPDFGRTRILLRPSGFFMKAADGSPIAPAETLEQAESEIGIAGYMDPETGEPVEEERPRLEEH